MTDRELLESAAKGAGYWDEKFQCADKLPRLGWDPLADNADAFRLMAKLNLSLSVQPLSMSATQYFGKGYLGGWLERGFDDEADYRRAIVRAAAALSGGAKHD